MSDLDDPQRIAAGDPEGMLGVIASLPQAMRAGFAAGRAATPPPTFARPSALVFCGMGGSAVAGDVLRAVYADRLPFPVEVVRRATPPVYAGPGTLVIASSYSGDTVETNDAFEAAVERGCTVAVVTSGGRLARRAEEIGAPRVTIPGGMQPRAAIGHLALGTIGLLEAAGLLPGAGDDVDEAVAEVERLVPTLAPTSPEGVNPAKRIARQLEGGVAVVWGTDGVAATAANRWRTQINENAKVPCFSSSLPELNHNELVGWSGDEGHGFSVVALRIEDETDEIRRRYAFSEEIVRSSGAGWVEHWASGRGPLARLMTLVAVGDFVSTYLALLRGIDPMPVPVIARLKASLAQP